MLAGQESADDIQFQDPVEFLDRILMCGGLDGPGPAGGVHQDVDAPEAAGHRVHHGPHLLLIGHVARDGKALSAGELLVKDGGPGAQRFGVPAYQGNVSAIFCEAFRDDGADAPCPACDDRHLPVEGTILCHSRLLPALGPMRASGVETGGDVYPIARPMIAADSWTSPTSRRTR